MNTRLVALAVIVCAASLPAAARGPYLDDAITQYPNIAGTKLDSCSICHTNTPALNPYGADFLAAGLNFVSIQGDDSDGDTVSNLLEITNITWPGDATDPPTQVPVLDVTPLNRDVDSGAGNTTFAVMNVGSGTLSWTASVISGSDWLMITSGSNGTNAGTIGAIYSANLGGTSRVGSIRVIANGASGSPADATVTQAGSAEGEGVAEGEGLAEGEGEGEAGTGMLRVTIQPPEVRELGARWRVDGGEWRDSGETVTVSAGFHTVSFRDIDDSILSGCLGQVFSDDPLRCSTEDEENGDPNGEGCLGGQGTQWRMPEDIIVSVQEGETTEAQGAYVQITEAISKALGASMGDLLVLSLAVTAMAAVYRRRRKMTGRA